MTAPENLRCGRESLNERRKLFRRRTRLLRLAARAHELGRDSEWQFYTLRAYECEHALVDLHTPKPLFRGLGVQLATLRLANSVRRVEPAPGKFSRDLKRAAMNALIYDVQIACCVPNSVARAGTPDDEHLPDLEYCEGWHDFQGMGISCIAAYDYATDLYHLFLDDNFEAFQALVRSRKHIVGFNSSAFDDPLCAAQGLFVTTNYDLLNEVRAASAQPAHYVYGETRPDGALFALAIENLGFEKASIGRSAPELWQRGMRGAVLNYALRDVQITKALFDRRAALRDPTNSELLTLREPHG